MGYSFSKDKYIYLDISYEQLVEMEQKAIAANDFPLLIRTYLNLFKYYFIKKQYTQSMTVLADCETLVFELNNEDLLLEWLRCKSMTLALNYQVNETIQILPKIIRMARVSGHQDLLALSFYMMSKSYVALKQYDVAAKYALASWYYAKEIDEDIQSIVYNHYCLCLLEQGKIEKVKEIYTKYPELQRPYRSKLISATLALEEGDIGQAIQQYAFFIQQVVTPDKIIFLDFELTHIHDRMALYLQTNPVHAEAAEIYTKTSQMIAQYAAHQFQAAKEYITTINSSMYPLEFFIINGQHLLSNSDAKNVNANMYIQLIEFHDDLLKNYLFEVIKLTIEKYMKENNLDEYLLGKVDENSIYFVSVANEIKEASVILCDIEAQINSLKKEGSGKFKIVTTLYSSAEKTDFFDIYSNTVAKIFI